MSIAPPANISELLQRANDLAGGSLEAAARNFHYPLPHNLKSEKGWIGQLLEHCLGATAGSKAEPDFPHLGIELKTLPVNEKGEPAESTYVCTVPLGENTELQWKASWVRRKLSHVLWFPVESRSAGAFDQRRFGTPFLWQPGPDEESQLREDWEELMQMICEGDLDKITAHHGNSLQIRPKAAFSRSLCKTSADNGAMAFTLPRGFYLRSRFTARILKQKFG